MRIFFLFFFAVVNKNKNPSSGRVHQRGRPGSKSDAITIQDAIRIVREHLRTITTGLYSHELASVEEVTGNPVLPLPQLFDFVLELFSRELDKQLPNPCYLPSRRFHRKQVRDWLTEQLKQVKETGGSLRSRLVYFAQLKPRRHNLKPWSNPSTELPRPETNVETEQSSPAIQPVDPTTSVIQGAAVAEPEQLHPSNSLSLELYAAHPLAMEQ